MVYSRKIIQYPKPHINSIEETSNGHTFRPASHEWIVNKTENWVVKIPPVTQQFAHIFIFLNSMQALKCHEIYCGTQTRSHIVRAHTVSNLYYITAAFRCIHKNTQPNSCLRPRINECDSYHDTVIHAAHIAHTDVDRWLCSKSFLHVHDPIIVE